MRMLPADIKPSNRGFSLLEMLAALGLLSIVMGTVVAFFFDVTYHSNDQLLMLQANQAARALIDELGSELRMAGNGLPLGQAGFSANDQNLGDAPLPVLPESREDLIVFRGNMTGDVYVLSSDFNPQESQTVKLASTEGLESGMEVYISDASANGSSALKGRISSVGTDTVILQSGFVATEDAIFASGSMLDPVLEIEFRSLADWRGIQRAVGGTTEILLPNSAFSINYLGSDGTAIGPALSASSVAEELSALALTVRVKARRKLRSGLEYVAELHRNIALRNVCLNR